MLAGDAHHAAAGRDHLDGLGVRRLRGRALARSSRRSASSPEERSELSTAWTWLGAGQFNVSLEILVDPLSLVMMLVVTGVGGLIVLYSNGYMAGDDEERRYFAYMAFFVFSMLLLVEGGNLLLLLVGWGLVGLASYLLIGFHHDRPSAIAAAKKAFVVNAVGDALMALALFLAIAKVGSLDYGAVFDAAETGALSDKVVALIALGLLGGAVAKSAQIPLHTWLPDAMEGPTPVSALIHAATMVTAGVYLICRTHPVFEAAPDVQHLAAILGLVTLLAAGLIALVQWDIKRVIAYSTMSQIGYMFVAAGIGAYGFAMFHLVTHAFFKALLFLAAGVDHPSPGRRAGHPQDGRPAQDDAVHARDVPDRDARARRDPAAGRVLVEGRDPRRDARRRQRARLGAPRRAGCSARSSRGSTRFRLYFKVFHGEPAEAHGHVRTRTSATARGRARCSSRSGCSRCSRSSAGSCRFPASGASFEDWLDPGRRAARRADRRAGLADQRDRGRGRRRRDPRRPRRRSARGREVVAEGGARTLLEHKFYFDELYDARLSRPYQLLASTAALRRRGAARSRVARQVAEREAGRSPAGSAGLQSGLLRTYVLGGHGRRRRPRDRLRGAALMQATLLIAIPMVSALVVWLLPVRRDWTEFIAGLAILADLGIWVGGLDIPVPGIEAPTGSTSRARPSTSRQHHTWIEELGFSYSVGFYGFQFWLVGLTLVVGAAAIGYGIQAGRERPRAYFGLHALPARVARRGLRLAGSAALLHLLRGDADPDLRARRASGAGRAG